ncbi:hypothetical protein C8R43DRAFT_908083 [Mycena crocata]|nr:hypothetical protein C8R43DRAFT_908057 [Mycena crocata]KAJ7093637.1 hypothetical protein C8R43DRAFT_908083 [Mycena crocata]
MPGHGDDEERAKRKRYASSDDTMGQWVEHDQFFLEWLLRRDGLGNNVYEPACSLCGKAHTAQRRLFRCAQCGEFLQCHECVKARHQLTPLHAVREWNGEFWTEAQLAGSSVDPHSGLVGVGLVYQIGHHGMPCPKPEPVRTMVVLDVSGIFTLDFCYCGCEESQWTNPLGQLLGNAWYPATTVDPATCATFQVLELFRMLNVVGNVNVHDFIGSLERLTDPLRLLKIPDRYKAFGRMGRQWGYLMRGKRAGRGHVENGLRTTAAGGLAVDCWPCPQDGNLPEGWQDVAPEYRFLYMLILALDANFRLKNRLRANEHQDPSLGAGLTYFVEPTEYKKHLKNYVAEKDVSSCIAFAALLQKETRLTTGLRVSGVGGCVCARHGVVRPLGIGDLQKGERYANMDYIFLSALAGVSILCLAISYDIACQWKINLPGRAKKILESTSITTNLDDFEIQFALPVWHAVAHEISCQSQNSLSYAVGVGRTDGEGIERTWAVLNPIAYSTKEMGDGARHDSIENKIDHLNFEKNIGQGNTLLRKLIVAIAERDKQVADFKEVDGSLRSKLRRDWEKLVDAWLKDKTQPNPYCIAGGKRPSETAVLQELKEAEAEEAREGRTPMSSTRSTASAFLKAGLQLEEAQRRIKAEVKGVTLVTADRSSQIQELRISLFKKLRTFERLQEVFMPGVADLREAEEAARNKELAPPKAEDIKLWLPSALSNEQRRLACRRGLTEMETKLRSAQCADALETLRSRLHAQNHLIQWRNSNSTGQRAATRSATLIGRVGDRIARVAGKYRDARVALMALKGELFAPQYKLLLPSDMNVNVEEEGDEKARKALGRLGSSRRARNEPNAKPKKFSWIWTAGGGPGEDSEAVHESVRVEWCKARARRDRWVEEVKMLREEMKRVLRILRTKQVLWRGRAVARGQEVDAQLTAGCRAYALRQAACHSRVQTAFHVGWSRSVATAVREVLQQDGTTYREILDGHAMDNVLELRLDLVEEDLEEGEGMQIPVVRRSSRVAAGAGAAGQ